MEESKYYLDPALNYLKFLKDDEINDIVKSYGKAGRKKYWRVLQREVSKIRIEFEPEGMKDYWASRDKEIVNESYNMVNEIETFLNIDIKGKLEEHYRNNWFINGLPKKVYDDCKKLAADKEYTSETKVEPWSCLVLINYRDIILYNWQNIFQTDYTMKTGEYSIGNKDKKTEWLVRLNKIRNDLMHSYTITPNDAEFLQIIYSWLIEKEE